MADLYQQVQDLEKKVAELSNVLSNDNYGRETRFTRFVTIEPEAVFRMVPDDATSNSNARYGEIYVNNDTITYIDSAGDVRECLNGIYTPTEYTADGAIDSKDTYVELNSSGTAIAMTIAVPEAGRFLVITQTDAGTDGHTVTLTEGTYDGTNDIATFNAQNETLVLFGISATRFVIVENIGSVGLS